MFLDDVAKSQEDNKITTISKPQESANAPLSESPKLKPVTGTPKLNTGLSLTLGGTDQPKTENNNSTAFSSLSSSKDTQAQGLFNKTVDIPTSSGTRSASLFGAGANPLGFPKSSSESAKSSIGFTLLPPDQLKQSNEQKPSALAGFQFGNKPGLFSKPPQQAVTSGIYHTLLFFY
jgi:hypothetical protein